MKVSLKCCGGLILSAAVLLGLTQGSENNCVTVTANVSVDNGLVCPEPTLLTCRTLGTVGTALRWHNDVGVIIDDIPVYNYQESDDFPQTLLPENASSAFISYVMENASFDLSMPTEVNFTALLVVNPELLLSHGYPTLYCAPGLTEGANFTINQIDMEIPGVPGGADFCLVYESPSYLLGQLTVQVEIPVYSSRSPCQYKEETYLSATLHVGDAVATNVTDTNCTDMTCSIQFLEVPEHSAETDDIHVSLVVGNRFGESAPVNFDTALFPASITSLFNLSVSVTACRTLVECAAVLQTPALPNCALRYGTDPSYETLSQTSLPVNEPSPLSGLEEGTVYYVEAIITSEGPGGTDRFFHLRTTFETGSCGPSSETIIGAVVGVAVLAVLVTALLTIVLICCYKSHKKSGSYHTDPENKQGEMNLRAAVNPRVTDSEPLDEKPYHELTDEIEVDPEHRKINEDMEAAYSRIAAEDVQKPPPYDIVIPATTAQHPYDEVTVVHHYSTLEPS